MSPMVFTCPKCRESLEGDPSMRGATVRCPACGTLFRVPSGRKRQILLPPSRMQANPAQSAAKPRPTGGGMRFFLVLVAVVLVAGTVLGTKNCAGRNPLVSASGFGRQTKEQWRNRLCETKLDYRIGLHGSPANYPQYGGTCTRDDFVSAMGDPDRTQTVGDQIFWYYNCRDGVIQVVLEPYWMEQGIVSADHVNDY